jgi:TPP-dependent indolepyruvate ferredoxin oxidoreductase alpha subunit
MPMDGEHRDGSEVLLMGNEAMPAAPWSRGEGGGGYPGTPSSEIIETLSRYSREGVPT